jgi:hypothetical protein
MPVPVAAPSKARTIFGRMNAGIVGSNPSRGMDMCMRFSVLCCVVLSCVGRGLASGRSPAKESYKNIKNVINFRS